MRIPFGTNFCDHRKMYLGDLDLIIVETAHISRAEDTITQRSSKGNPFVV